MDFRVRVLGLGFMVIYINDAGTEVFPKCVCVRACVCVCVCVLCVCVCVCVLMTNKIDTGE